MLVVFVLLHGPLLVIQQGSPHRLGLEFLGGGTRFFVATPGYGLALFGLQQGGMAVWDERRSRTAV